MNRVRTCYNSSQNETEEAKKKSTAEGSVIRKVKPANKNILKYSFDFFFVNFCYRCYLSHQTFGVVVLTDKKIRVWDSEKQPLVS